MVRRHHLFFCVRLAYRIPQGATLLHADIDGILNVPKRSAPMTYHGSCHCGRIAYDVEGDLQTAMECNCSHCSRKGYLLWFVSREQFTLNTPDAAIGTYRFNKHVIEHQFCMNCGCAPFALGSGPGGKPMASINVRCLEGVDLAGLEIRKFDGRSR
jgi:hypothetical protein